MSSREGGQRKSVLDSVFGVFTRPQTYMGMLYLLLAFPLGIAYFVFLVTGISVGAGLIVVWVGVPILALVLAASWLLTAFEREAAIRLLREDIPPIVREDRTAEVGAGLETLSTPERLLVKAWRLMKVYLGNSATWTGLVYLFVKFPIGIASFVVTVVLVSVTVAFLGAPIFYRQGQIDFGIWRVDTLGEALVLVPAGIVLGFITVHVLNLAAQLSGRFARVMLAAR